MATQYETERDPSIATLVSGIVNDAKELIVKQLTLFQVEIKNDIRNMMMALIPIIAGAGVFVLSLLLLAAAAALFLPWYFPNLPTWGGFAIVGATIGITGAILVFVGSNMLKRVNPLPEKAMEGLKENLQWKTKN